MLKIVRSLSGEGYRNTRVGGWGPAADRISGSGKDPFYVDHAVYFAERTVT